MIQALLVMLAVGAVCGLILGIAGKKFYVEKDTRVEDIRALLPGLNCGGCGIVCGGYERNRLYQRICGKRGRLYSRR